MMGIPCNNSWTENLNIFLLILTLFILFTNQKLIKLEIEKLLVDFAIASLNP